MGTRVGRDNKVYGRPEIMLYENGEYEILKPKNRTGRFLYSYSTGRLDIERDFSNSRISPRRDYCVYGIDEQTKQHTIVARDGSIRYRLVWSNPPDRFSPTERKELEILEQHAESRYQYTTQPGQGIQSEDIEAVVYTSELGVGVGGALRNSETLCQRLVA